MGQARESRIADLRRYIARHWGIIGENHNARFPEWLRVDGGMTAEMWVHEHLLDGLEAAESNDWILAMRCLNMANRSAGTHWPSGIAGDAAIILQNSIEDVLRASMQGRAA